MTKYKKQFEDYAMQCMYENLRKDGISKNWAVNETVIRFREYDEGQPLSVFVKQEGN